MEQKEARKKFEAAFELLHEKTTSKKAFENIRTLIAGLDPRIDQVLTSCSNALKKLEHLEKGEFIELSAEQLPEKTEEEKKRKKALLLFLKSWRQLTAEVERVKGELKKADSQGKIQTSANILTAAKGPFGVITLLAVAIVGVLTIANRNKQNIPLPIKEQKVITPAKIQAIIFNDKKIPLTELQISQGPECDQASHYHAKDHTAAKTLDGETILDPGNCGFGKVKDTRIIEVSP